LNDSKDLETYEYHPDMAESVLTMGLYYCESGDLSDALNYFEKYSLIIEAICDSFHPLLAQSFHILGRYLLTVGQLKKAQIFINSSFDILRMKDSSCATLLFIEVMVSKAFLSDRLGYYRDAMKTYEEVLKLLETLTDSCGVDYMYWLEVTKLNIARVSLMLGEYNDVKKILNLEGHQLNHAYSRHHNLAVKKFHVSDRSQINLTLFDT
jgi:tetratricopeptide (TPR) repeat protein